MNVSLVFLLFLNASVTSFWLQVTWRSSQLKGEWNRQVLHCILYCSSKIWLFYDVIFLKGSWLIDLWNKGITWRIIEEFPLKTKQSMCRLWGLSWKMGKWVPSSTLSQRVKINYTSLLSCSLHQIYILIKFILIRLNSAQFINLTHLLTPVILSRIGL